MDIKTRLLDLVEGEPSFSWLVDPDTVNGECQALVDGRMVNVVRAGLYVVSIEKRAGAFYTVWTHPDQGITRRMELL